MWSYRTTLLSQSDFTSGWISLSKTAVCLEGYVFLWEKDWYIDAKSDDKESVLLFLHKNSVIIGMCVSMCVCGGGGGGGGEGGRDLRDWGKFFLKIGKWITSTIKDKKVNY